MTLTPWSYPSRPLDKESNFAACRGRTLRPLHITAGNDGRGGAPDPIAST